MATDRSTKTCAELFEGLHATIIGNENEPVEGIAYRSDAVKPGDMFFCIVGFKVDGHSFAQEAIDRGAKVIVAQRRLYLADATDVTVVIVSDTRSAMAHASCIFYDDPSASFKLVGITGTNGKTTTTYLVEAIGHEAGLKTGVIGTVGMRIGDKVFGTEHTTPESPDLQRVFAEMRDEGCELVAIEVSSHALDLSRVAGSKFAVTAFTNLTQDHLDYHHTLEAYFEAKAKLFSDLYPAKRVIGADKKWGKELARRCAEENDSVITTGFDSNNDISVIHADFNSVSTTVDLSVKFGGTASDRRFTYDLVGPFNVENVMTAYGIGLSLGIDQEVIENALSEKCLVPGRLERVRVDEGSDNGKLPTVFIDYAHTPDALEKAISALRPLTDGRLLVVFGCGGDRDSTKRPLMGEAALASDVVVVTSDNPRSEDPMAIIDDILNGLDNAKRITEEELASVTESHAYAVIPDRHKAIVAAVRAAKDDDVVLIAGKGHEDYQIIGTEKHHFDDHEEAANALALRAGSSCSSR